jgi:3-phosphoshikimate 1-carboxyvinyltransferase
MNWLIHSSTHLHGITAVPGDKSISHRALMHAALAHGTSRVNGFLHAGVTDAMVRGVRDLGVAVEIDRDALIVHGGSLNSPSHVLDCGNSGATIRLLAGALAGQRGLIATLDGSSRLRRRPMKRVTEPLHLMGAELVDDAPPIHLSGRKLHGIDYTLPVASAQVKAAILLAALQAEGSTTIHEPGPSRDHSERLLQAIGIAVETRDHAVTLSPQHRSLPPFEIDVPGDMSSAAFLLAAAAMAQRSEVTVQSVGVNPTRTGLLDALIQMGAEIEIFNQHEVNCEPIADVTVRSSELRGITIDGEWVVRMIDEFPVLAVLATQAHGETIVRDAAELRVKESDRIGSLASELRKLGAHIEERSDGFVIDGPTRLRGAVVDSYGDHRLAMSLAIAGLIADGETTILNAEAYRESFPNFVELMRGLRGNIE